MMHVLCQLTDNAIHNYHAKTDNVNERMVSQCASATWDMLKTTVVPVSCQPTGNATQDHHVKMDNVKSTMDSLCASVTWVM
jgi:hypothetical protein